MRREKKSDAVLDHRKQNKSIICLKNDERILRSKSMEAPNASPTDDPGNAATDQIKIFELSIKYANPEDGFNNLIAYVSFKDQTRSTKMNKKLDGRLESLSHDYHTVAMVQKSSILNINQIFENQQFAQMPGKNRPHNQKTAEKISAEFLPR